MPTSRSLRRVMPWLVVTLLLLGNLGLARASVLPAESSSHGGPSIEGSPTPTATTVGGVLGAEAASAGETAPEPFVRPRPEARGYDNPVEIDEETGIVWVVGQDGQRRRASGEVAATPTAEAEPPAVPRLDQPILRWLPEIMAASTEWGVPAELIAGMMHLESTGEPGVISPAGARGLMQIMPDQLAGQGLPEALWHDPASNVMAGGHELHERTLQWGSLEGAVQSYFGFGCDIFGTCTEVYVRVAFGWADYYRPIIADPLGFGFAVLPAGWSFGPIVLYQVDAPPPPEEPPPPPTPRPGTRRTPTPRPTATPPRPGETPPATREPTDPATGVPATEVPVAIPTEVPVEVPTEFPVEVPTEVPVEVPTEIPVEVPTEIPVEEPTVVEDPPEDAG